MNIRLFKKSDTEQIARLFHNTIREVNSRNYTQEQLRAWAPDDIHFKDWEKACTQKHTWVADAAGQIVGFAQLEEDGYIDCFFCHKDFQGVGVGTSLYNRLEEEARSKKLNKLYAEASITARTFFVEKGFTEVSRQEVSVRGSILTNYLMEKNFNRAEI